MAKKDTDIDTIEEIIDVDNQPKKDIKVHKKAIIKMILLLVLILALVIAALALLNNM